MACIRKRRGKWVLDYRDSAGMRRWITKDTKRKCEDELARILPGTRQASRPEVNANITVNDYARVWTEALADRAAGKTLKRRTLESYQKTLRIHILHALGTLRVRDLRKARIKTLLTEKQRDGYTKTVGAQRVQVSYAKDSVRIILATLRAMLNAAIDDEVISANPADKLGKRLRLVTSKTTRQEEVKAMNREQLAHFLAVTAEEDPRHYPLSLLWPGPACGSAKPWHSGGRTSISATAASVSP